jgi:uncharacterized membrane protein
VSAEAGRLHRSRSVDRLITFSDGIVAVAVTLLALPLVDIAPGEGQSVWAMLVDNRGQVIAFLFTFGVVGIMWLAHNRILNGIRAFDGAVFWLNTGWLAAIVLLPWVSALYGESEWIGDGAAYPGVGMLYWGTLALISLFGLGMSLHLRRHPGLLDEPASEIGRRGELRGAVFGGYFLFIGLMTLVAPSVAAWLPFGIIAISIWLGSAFGGRNVQPAQGQNVGPEEE